MNIRSFFQESLTDKDILSILEIHKLDPLFQEITKKDEPRQAEVKKTEKSKRFRIERIAVHIKPLAADNAARILKTHSQEIIDEVLKLQTPEKAAEIRKHLEKKDSEKPTKEIDEKKAPEEVTSKKGSRLSPAAFFSRLLPNAKAGKDTSKEIVRSEHTCDFT